MLYNTSITVRQQLVKSIFSLALYIVNCHERDAVNTLSNTMPGMKHLFYEESSRVSILTMVCAFIQHFNGPNGATHLVELDIWRFLHLPFLVRHQPSSSSENANHQVSIYPLLTFYTMRMCPTIPPIIHVHRNSIINYRKSTRRLR